MYAQAASCDFPPTPTLGSATKPQLRHPSTKTAKAISACDKQLGIKATHGFAGGAGGGARRTAPPSATLTKFVARIRTHGYAAMPEASKSTSSGGGFFPKSVESNAAFKKALPSCESLLQTATPQAGTSTT